MSRGYDMHGHMERGLPACCPPTTTSKSKLKNTDFLNMATTNDLCNLPCSPNKPPKSTDDKQI